MRPIRAGLLLTMFAMLAAPVAAISAPKPPPGPPPAYSPGQVKQGMAEAGGAVQRAGIPCQISSAAWVGSSKADKKTGTPERALYEVACSGSLGFILQADKDGPVAPFSCLESQGSANPCKLAENANPNGLLQAAMTKTSVPCTLANVRLIGQTTDSTYIEAACQGNVGYILKMSRPVDMDKAFRADNCLAYDAAASNLKCTLAEPASRLLVIDSYVTTAKVACPIKERRYVGQMKDGTTAFEAACQDGKGYVLRVDSKGGVAATECVKAPGLCELSDARLALTEQAGLYTRLAKSAGSTCDVASYAVFPTTTSGLEAVELTCKDGSEAVGLFPASGKGQVLDCDHALVAGYRCAPGHANYSGLTADLKKLGKPDCAVSEIQLRNKNPKGNHQIEVACKDGLPGYVVEYSNPTTPIDAIGCRLTSCGLPSNNRPRS